MHPTALQEALRQTQQARRDIELERVRSDADLIRARCQSFAGFVKEAWHVIEPSTTLKWNWHMQAMCDVMQAAFEGIIEPRVIINVPPGSSKSTIVTVLFQAWIWGPRGEPGKRFVSSAFEMGNVKRDTRRCRDLIMSEWYQALWPIDLKRNAEASFENFDFGYREGVPFASLTGKRGDILCIDDPHSLDQSESEVEREKAVRRFVEGGQNRINDWEKSVIVIVMQRLHEGDLTGAILARDMGYCHLMLPMEFEPERKCVILDKTGKVFFEDPRTYDGELLDPVRFPRASVEAYANDNEYAHASQNQQRPVPRTGGMFKIGMIQIADSVPANAQRVRGWDIAGSTKQKSPYTVGAHLAYADGIVYIVDVRRERKEIDQAERLIVETVKDDHSRYGTRILNSLPQDPGQAGKAQRHHLAARLGGTNFKFSPESGTKEDRAIPFASMVNAGSVRMIKADWNKPLIDELGLFPGSVYKDQVDALSRAFMELHVFMGDDEEMIVEPMYGHKLLESIARR